MAQRLVEKINSLMDKGYTSTRHCLGDGNCYYRAIYYAYFEELIKQGPRFVFAFLNM